MIYRLFSTAVIAGLIAGLVVSVLQQIQVEPLILAAEVYELQVTSEQSVDRDSSAHEHGEADSAESGFERMLYTLLANLGLGIGYGLLLCSAFTFYNRSIGTKRGLLWGLAGFAAFSFIPAIGLPPEIPGMVGADLLARQTWWLSSAIASCIGLALISFAPRVWWRILGGLVILLPFIAGAPHPPASANAGSNLPPDLVAHFTMATLVMGIVFWGLLGGAAGYLFERARVDLANKHRLNSIKSR